MMLCSVACAWVCRDWRVFHRHLRGRQIRLDILDGLLSRLRREILRHPLAERLRPQGREFGLVGEVVTAANTASVCSCERIACSLAWMPYCTVTD